MGHLHEFALEQMEMDYLEMLTHSHLAVADKDEDGSKSERCVSLVGGKSYSVDCRWSGTPIDIKAMT